jgi:hypothetical protein
MSSNNIRDLKQLCRQGLPHNARKKVWAYWLSLNLSKLQPEQELSETLGELFPEAKMPEDFMAAPDFGSPVNL